uniref:Uncharacterized protein n=1 Tax=viral metagenome TaxID=1070528 RepID=A0A6C0L8N7_9ZZZZ
MTSFNPKMITRFWIKIKDQTRATDKQQANTKQTPSEQQANTKHND